MVQSPAVLDLRRCHKRPAGCPIPDFTHRAITVDDGGWVITGQVRRSRKDDHDNATVLLRVRDPQGLSVLIVGSCAGRTLWQALSDLLTDPVARLFSSHRGSREKGWAQVRLLLHSARHLASVHDEHAARCGLWEVDAVSAAITALQWALRGASADHVRSYGLVPPDPTQYCFTGDRFRTHVEYVDVTEHRGAQVLLDQGFEATIIREWRTYDRPASVKRLSTAGWTHADAMLVRKETREDPVDWRFCADGAQACLFIAAHLSPAEARVAVADPSVYPEDSLRALAGLLAPAAA